MDGLDVVNRLGRCAVKRSFVILIAGFVTPALATAAGPSNVTVTQEGLAFRITWTPEPGASGSWFPEVSKDPSFAYGVGCSGYSALPTVLLKCLTVFDATTVYVRVGTAAGGKTVAQVPLAQFKFAPAPVTPAATLAMRNRQTFVCATTGAEWTNIDAETLFYARILVGGRERIKDTALVSPITGIERVAAEKSLSYAATAEDIGSVIRCEISARQGGLSATRTTDATVGRALVQEMDPARMLDEAARAKSAVAFDGAKRVQPTTSERRAGALTGAELSFGSLGVSGARTTLAKMVVFRTPRQADAQVDRRICSQLLRLVPSLLPKRGAGMSPRGVLYCHTAKVKNARRVIRAAVYGVSPYTIVSTAGVSASPGVVIAKVPLGHAASVTPYQYCTLVRCPVPHRPMFTASPSRDDAACTLGNGARGAVREAERASHGKPGTATGGDRGR